MKKKRLNTRTILKAIEGKNVIWHNTYSSDLQAGCPLYWLAVSLPKVRVSPIYSSSSEDVAITLEKSGYSYKVVIDFMNEFDKCLTAIQQGQPPQGKGVARRVVEHLMKEVEEGKRSIHKSARIFIHEG